jgi:hypothetical protein
MKIVAALVVALGLLSSTVRQEAADFPDLAVKIVDVEAVSKHFPGSLITLEVKNEGTTWVEPLAFVITPKGKDAAPITAERVLPPVYGRAGRVIAPNKKDRFIVQVRQSPPDLGGAKARVSLATVHSTETLGSAAKDVVRVGKKRVEEQFDALRNERLPRTWVPLANQLASPIDVTLRLELEGRFPCSALVRTRLAPNEEVDFVISEILFFPIDDEGITGGPIGVDAKSVELVDWSVVVDDGAALARAELERAWNSWARIAPEMFPMRAPFRAHVVLIGRFGNLGERFDLDENVLGTIVVEANGDFTLLDEAGKRLVGGVERELREAVGPAVLHMARPTLDEALAPCKLSLLSSGDEVHVAIEGNERIFGSKLADVAIADGRIASTGWIDAASLGRRVWSSRVEADGRWRVDESFLANDTQGDERLTLRFGDGGALVRIEHTTEGKLLQDPTSIVVRFGTWSSNAAPAAAEPAPTGELADRLRAAWDAFHRHPDPEATIQGSYVVTTPGTDGVWLGRTRVEGTFELAGMEDVFWRHSRTTVAEKKISKYEHDVLANAVEDRILMWSGPDLCRRPRFDVEFAGAALTAGEDGWIVVERARWTGVQLVDGHVAAVRNGSGAVTTIRWEELEGARLPVEYRTGDVVVLLDWARVDEKWFHPKRAEFSGNFGPDWGPEVIVFDVDGVR